MDAYRTNPVIGSHGSSAPATLDASTTLGEMLREAREQRGLTLDEISASTNIPVARLDAFENADIGEMPLGMYQRAEIRAFADAVGLDPRIALATIERRQAPPSVSAAPAIEAPRFVPATPAPQKPANDPRRIAPTVSVWRPAPIAITRSSTRYLLAAVATVAIVAVGWLGMRTASTTSRSSLTPAASAVGAPSAAAPAAAAPSGRVAPAPASAAATGGSTQARSTDTQLIGPGPVTTPAAPVQSPNLRVVSEPSGARVTVDGIGWGQTPVTIRYLPLGAKRIRVTRDGYATQERIVQLSSETPTTTVSIALRRQR